MGSKKIRRDKLPDEEIVRMALIEADFYAELIKRYQKKIYYYIARLINQYSDAEDLTQETFIKAYENLASFNRKLKFSSWLFRIAHNHAVNFIKKNYRQKVISLEKNSYLKETLEAKDNLAKELIGKENKKELFNALQQLPLKYRSPIELFFFEGKTYTEISDILQIPTNSVSPLLIRGKKKIKEVLEKRR